MAFKLFERKRKVFREPMVTILKQGTIGLNTAAVEKYFLDKQYVLLYYDEGEQKIGLKPLKVNKENAYKIRMGKISKGGNCSAQAFLRSFKIDHSTTRTYRAKWNNKDKIIFIDLTEKK